MIVYKAAISNGCLVSRVLVLLLTSMCEVVVEERGKRKKEKDQADVGTPGIYVTVPNQSYKVWAFSRESR